jgi:hypothetical protein
MLTRTDGIIKRNKYLFYTAAVIIINRYCTRILARTSSACRNVQKLETSAERPRLVRSAAKKKQIINSLLS